MQHLSRFASLAERFDGFVLDLWGVIHDGIRAFPHAVETLRHLKATGKRTLLLSNAPRPNEAVQRMMLAQSQAPDMTELQMRRKEEADHADVATRS